METTTAPFSVQHAEPLPIAKLSPGRVQALNALVGQRRYFHFQVGDIPCRLYLTATPQKQIPALSAPTQPLVYIQLQLGQTQCWVSLKSLPSAFFNPLLGLQPEENVQNWLQNLPAEICPILLEGLSDQLLTQLQVSAGGIPIKINQVSFEPPPSSFTNNEYRFYFVIEERLRAAWSFGGQIAVQQAALPLLAAWVQPSAVVPAQNLSSLPIPVAAYVGSTILPAGAYRDLALGDVILLDEDCQFTQGFCKTVIANQFAFRCRIESRPSSVAITIIEPLPNFSPSTAMNPDNPSRPNTPAPNPPASAPNQPASAPNQPASGVPNAPASAPNQPASVPSQPASMPNRPSLASAAAAAAAARAAAQTEGGGAGGAPGSVGLGGEARSEGTPTPPPTATPAPTAPTVSSAKPAGGNASAPAPAGASNRLAGLPVDVLFEVGTTQLSFQELSTLQSGFVFQLNQSMDRPIRIRANGKVIGEGELVQVGERLGVRIVAMFEE